jgi:hypothetical protein
MSTNIDTMPEITTWAELPGGGHRRGFQIRGCNVQVTPSGSGRDADAAQLAVELAAAAVGITARWDALVAERDASRRLAAARLDRVVAAEQRIPPPAPARLLGTACVRFDDRGRPWLLNKRESGWSSWGVVCDGWDDMFRRYAVVITAHGTDEHGPWWTAEPAR